MNVKKNCIFRTKKTKKTKPLKRYFFGLLIKNVVKINSAIYRQWFSFLGAGPNLVNFHI